MRRVKVGMLWVAMIFLAMPAGLLAQAGGTIRGRVTSSAGQPLSGAQVTIEGTTRGSLSNAQGQYVIGNVPAGSYTVLARQVGFSVGRGTVTVAAGASVAQDFTLNQEALSLETITVSVGSRATHTAANELAVPVDVFPVAEIQAAARMDMADILQELSPAINFDRPQIADLTSGVRPFQMRGLSPDHSLVLINGKRRHPTAVVHVFGGAALTTGSSGVDMNSIPSQALGQMEILRDGAAAQYGSDAIAGVINMGLKNTITAPSFTATYGVHHSNWNGHETTTDGQRWDIGGNVGLPLFSRGSLNITAQYGARNRTNRACPDPLAQQTFGAGRTGIGQGDADIVENCRIVKKNNPVPQPTFLYGDGAYDNAMVFLNAELPLVSFDRGPTLYAFGGYANRLDRSAGNFRRANNNNNWPKQYPNGFLPEFSAVTQDMNGVLGVRGDLFSAWRFDLSGQAARNRIDNTIVNSLNTSLGPCFEPAAPCAPGPDRKLGTADDPGFANKTEFEAGSLELTQLSSDFDMTRQFEIGLAAPLNVAMGASYRADNYKVIEGEPASYTNGFHRNQYNSADGAGGSQVFFGFSPQQSSDNWRTNVGLWTDLETDLTSMIRVATAARFENYSDFGSTVTGKVAARFQPIEALVLRAAASTGFRAPGLSQSNYAHVTTAFRNDANGIPQSFEGGIFPVESEEAIALGAKPLQEEKSQNYSAGFALTPFTGFNLTADYYRIYVDDRIILSNSLTVSNTPAGSVIGKLLAPYGVTDVRYFLNSFNTLTEGVDLTAGYRHLFGDDKLLETTVSYNYGTQELQGEVATPEVLANLGAFLFPQTTRTAIEKGRPRDRVNTRVRYSQGPITAQLTSNYYGKIVSAFDVTGANGAINTVLFDREGKAVTDFDVGFEFRPGMELSVGAENIFDIYPTRNPVANQLAPGAGGQDNNGMNPYSSAGFGRNGRFLWTRLSVAF